MNFGSMAKNTIAAVALCGLTLAPLSAMAQGRHNGRSDRSRNSKWNSAQISHGQNYRNDSHYGRNDTNYRYGQSEYDRRNQTKNEWKNLAIGSGLVGVLGLLTHDSRLTFAGAAGSLYSAYRYEQDRKSQSKEARARAYYFSQPYFYRDGQRFDRRTVVKNGQRYYQFIRK